LLEVGISVFATGAVLEFLLVAVALANIEKPTSWIYATLTIVAMSLLIVGLLIISAARARANSIIEHERIASLRIYH